MPKPWAFRRALEDVLASRALDHASIESIRVDATTAAQLKFAASPTIRVNGRDIEPSFEDPGSYPLSCRVYRTSEGLRGAPEIEWIERAVDEALGDRA